MLNNQEKSKYYKNAVYVDIYMEVMKSFTIDKVLFNSFSLFMVMRILQTYHLLKQKLT